MEGNNVRARGFARAAGRKGGERVSLDRRHMAEIGRMGGKSSAARRSTRSGDDSDDSNGGTAGALAHEGCSQAMGKGSPDGGENM